MGRGSAKVVSVATLMLVTISLGVITYLIISPHIDVGNYNSLAGSKISLARIEGYELKGRRLTLYLSNNGPSTVTFTEALIKTPKGRVVKVRIYSSEHKHITTAERSIEVWGGDVWSVNTEGRTSLISREQQLTQELSTGTTELWGGDVWGIKDSSIYLKSHANPREIEIASTSGEVEVWGGDTWEVSSNSVVRTSEGLILYDDFRSFNGVVWSKRHNSYASKYSVTVSNNYLIAKVKSSQSRKWAVAGISSKNPINLPSNYVIEVEIFKYGRAYWGYAVSMYLASSSSNSNPYFNTPWFAIKLYPRGSRTYAQLVYRGTSLTYRDLRWFSGSTYPHIHVLAKVSRGKATVWLWAGTRSSSPVINGRSYSIPTLSGSKYVFLVTENPTTYYDEGRFGYVKIYRSTSFTIRGLQRGWWVELRVGDQVCKVMADGNELTIDSLNPPSQCRFLRDEYLRHGYPIRTGIRVFRYSSTVLKVEDLYPGWNVTIAKGENVCVLKVPTKSSSIEIDFSNPPQGCEWLRSEYVSNGFPVRAELRIEKWVSTKFTMRLSGVSKDVLSKWVLHISTEYGSCSLTSKSLDITVDMSDSSTCKCLSQYLSTYGMPVKVSVKAEIDLTKGTNAVIIRGGEVAKVVIELPNDGLGPYVIRLLSKEGITTVVTIWRR